MDEANFISNNLNITKKGVRKWAQDWARRFKDLRRALEKADDGFDDVLKGLEVDAPTWRTFRNQARKLKREVTTPARFKREVLKLVDRELKQYTKIADGLTD